VRFLLFCESYLLVAVYWWGPVSYLQPS